jgi:hypothetical protein
MLGKWSVITPTMGRGRGRVSEEENGVCPWSVLSPTNKERGRQVSDRDERSDRRVEG